MDFLSGLDGFPFWSFSLLLSFLSFHSVVLYALELSAYIVFYFNFLNPQQCTFSYNYYYTHACCILLYPCMLYICIVIKQHIIFLLGSNYKHRETDADNYSAVFVGIWACSGVCGTAIELKILSLLREHWAEKKREIVIMASPPKNRDTC